MIYFKREFCILISLVFGSFVEGLLIPTPPPVKTDIGHLVKRGTATTYSPPTPYPSYYTNAAECWSWNQICYNDVNTCFSVGMHQVLDNVVNDSNVRRRPSLQ